MVNGTRLQQCVRAAVRLLLDRRRAAAAAGAVVRAARRLGERLALVCRWPLEHDVGLKRREIP